VSARRRSGGSPRRHRCRVPLVRAAGRGVPPSPVRAERRHLAVVAADEAPGPRGRAAAPLRVPARPSTNSTDWRPAMSATASDDMISVLVGPEALVSARMLTRAERQMLGIDAPDVPVLSVKRPGEAEELFDARLVEIVVGGPQDLHP
jgi:hypothetical protein